MATDIRPPHTLSPSASCPRLSSQTDVNSNGGSSTTRVDDYPELQVKHLAIKAFIPSSISQYDLRLRETPSSSDDTLGEDQILRSPKGDKWRRVLRFVGIRKYNLLTKTTSLPIYNLKNEGIPELLEQLMAENGRSTHAAFLDASYSIYIPDDRQCAICFKVSNNVAVMYGDPLCASQQMGRVFETFKGFCKRQGWRVAVVGAGPVLADHGRRRQWAIMEFGVENVLNPKTNPGVGKTINRGNRRLAKEGVKLSVYCPAEGRRPELEAALMKVYDDWRESRIRRNVPQAYSTVINPFTYTSSKHLYTTGPDGIPNSWACLMRLGSRSGYLIEPCIAADGAPGGITEFLTTNAMRILKDERCDYLTFGLAPLPEMGEISGMTSFVADTTRSLYQTTFEALSLGGKVAFHEKFKPDEDQRSPLYLIFPSGARHMNSSKAVLDVTHISVSEVWTRSRAAAAAAKAKAEAEMKAQQKPRKQRRYRRDIKKDSVPLSECVAAVEVAPAEGCNNTS
jgi:hypothetical protein